MSFWIRQPRPRSFAERTGIFGKEPTIVLTSSSPKTRSEINSSSLSSSSSSFTQDETYTLMYPISSSSSSETIPKMTISAVVTSTSGSLSSLSNLSKSSKSTNIDVITTPIIITPVTTSSVIIRQHEVNISNNSAAKSTLVEELNDHISDTRSSPSTSSVTVSSSSSSSATHSLVEPQLIVATPTRSDQLISRTDQLISSLSALSNVKHVGITCNICGRSNFNGARYICTLCPYYNLCYSCEAMGSHDRSHPLVKLAQSNPTFDVFTTLRYTTATTTRPLLALSTSALPTSSLPTSASSSSLVSLPSTQSIPSRLQSHTSLPIQYMPLTTYLDVDTPTPSSMTSRKVSHLHPKPTVDDDNNKNKQRRGRGRYFDSVDVH